VQIVEAYVKVTLAYGAWKIRTSVSLEGRAATIRHPTAGGSNRKLLFRMPLTPRSDSFLTGEWTGLL